MRLLTVTFSSNLNNLYCTCPSFPFLRVLLKSEEEKLVIAAERVLVQPYSMLVNLERNLCPWYTKTPLLSMVAQMGTFQVMLSNSLKIAFGSRGI